MENDSFKENKNHTLAKIT